MTQREMAELVAAAVEESGRTERRARVWVGGDVVRVYVTRELSRGRQDMGFIAIEPDGARNYAMMAREKSSTRDRVEAALRAVQS